MPNVTNFCPTTGVGRFDADLVGNIVTIRHKIYLLSQPDVIESIQAHAAGGNAVWQLQQSIDSQAADFRNRFEPLIKQHWEDKFGFIRAGAPGQVIRPRFDISYRQMWMGTHFVVNLKKGQGGSESVSRDPYGEVPDQYGGMKPCSTSFFTNSTNPASLNALWTDLISSFPYHVETYNGAVSQHSETQLRFLGRQLAAADPRVPVKVTAYGAAKGNARRSVVTMLRNSGLTRVSHRMSKKPVWRSSSSPTTQRSDYVKVILGGDWDPTQRPANLGQDFSYPATVVHEYGHMLGLQDEYHCLSQQGSQALTQFGFADMTETGKYTDWHVTRNQDTADRPAAGQFEFIKYCRDAGVDPPHFGQHSTSIMSAGSHFMPCHYVTIWAALQQMEPHTNWQIVSL